MSKRRMVPKAKASRRTKIRWAASLSTRKEYAVENGWFIRKDIDDYHRFRYER